MKASIFLSCSLLAAALTGCSLGSETPPAPASPYTDLPPVTSTLAGTTYDPEAFYYLYADFPAPPDLKPPAALYEGIPYHSFSTIPGATILAVAPDGTSAAETESSPLGSWQLTGIALSDTPYQTRAVPPATGVKLGEGYMNPEAPPPDITAPASNYFPTTTLRPIVPLASLCQLQVATLVGDAGALSALAKALNKPVAELLSTKYGGVALMWVYTPSFDRDLFTEAADGISAATNRGTLYAINWSTPVAGKAGQSAMGFNAVAVKPGVLSNVGYYALLLSQAEAGSPVTVTFKDTVTGDMYAFPRPWTVPPLVAQIPPGVSFARVFSQPGDDGSGGPDPTAEPTPAPESNSQCYPQEGPP